MNVQLRNVEEVTIVGIRKEQPRNQVSPFISSSAISLLVYLKEAGIAPSGYGFTITYLRNGNEEENGSVDIEACIPVSKSGQDRGEIHFHSLSGGNAACLLVKGAYDQLDKARAELRSWCEKNKHNFTQIRDVFLKGPQETKNSAEYETEIQFL